ncbi:hypothetical protein BY996DRAFT_6774729, partial [Phakopsora pachyrhizi]
MRRRQTTGKRLKRVINVFLTSLILLSTLWMIEAELSQRSIAPEGFGCGSIETAFSFPLLFFKKKKKK